MNFLAHLFLSGDDENILVGNLMEDFVVGRIDHPRNTFVLPQYHQGIVLHRFIDSFTDSHFCVSEAKKLIAPDLGKYASVAIDVYFDHFLAIHWQTFMPEKTLPIYSLWVYEVYEQHFENLPEKMKPMIEAMIQHDWLKNYAELWAIERAFFGLSKRTRFESNLAAGLEPLKANFAALEKLFLQFFPEIVKACKNWEIKKAGKNLLES